MTESTNLGPETVRPERETYTFIPLPSDPAAVELVRDLFECNGNSKERNVLSWQYLGPPGGALHGEAAVLDKDVAGVYVVIARPACVFGNSVRACQSLDTLTDRDHRGQGLFRRLAERTYQRADAAGESFVYGFPNGSSGPGFFGGLGWESLDPVPFMFRPLRSRYLLAKVATRLSRLPDVKVPVLRGPGQRRHTVTEFQRFDGRHEDLWRRVAGAVIGIDRSSEYLNWRMVDRPPGRLYTLLQVEDDGAVLGFVAFRVIPKHGGTIGYIMELLSDGSPTIERTLLTHALRRMQEEGADLALAWNLEHSATHRAFLQTGFLPMPERLRPIELHFGAKYLDDRPPGRLADRTAWYLSYCDSDTV